jgi:hypothetical protein
MEYKPGTSLSLVERQKIIDKCLIVLKDDRFANINFVADHFLHIEIKYLDDAIIIACRISENSKYDWAFSQIDGWPYLFVNPNYKDRTWPEKNPVLDRVRTGAITAAFSLLVGLFLWLLSNQKQAREDNQQDKRLNSLSDSIANLQRHINTLK